MLSARCISKAWVCDGDSDCEDNSDEDNCEALVCKLSYHVCATNDSICLPTEKLCDGTDDCPDGSDEKLCGTAFFTHKNFYDACGENLSYCIRVLVWAAFQPLSSLFPFRRLVFV